MNCKKCGAVLQPNDKFCGNCGAEFDFDATAKIEPINALDYRPVTPYVPNNSNKNSYTNKNQDVITDVKKQNTKNKTLIIVIIVLISVLSIFTIFNTVVLIGITDEPKDSFLDDYRQSVYSLLGIEKNDYDDSEEYTGSDYTEPYTEETTSTTTTTTTTVPPTTQITDYYDNSSYLFPSDTQLLTEEYLNSKSKNEIDLIRNEIYARHGYIFQMEEFYNYFIQKSWYRPTEPNMDKAYEHFNSIEKQNIEILVKYQNLK